MSRRRNGTNRAQSILNASRYTGYGKPIKKAVTFAEVNDHINKTSHVNCKRFYGGNQDDKRNN